MSDHNAAAVQVIATFLHEIRTTFKGAVPTEKDRYNAAALLARLAAHEPPLRVGDDRASEIAQLREALQMLMDRQNGPPLIRDAAKWHAAMEQARAALRGTR